MGVSGDETPPCNPTEIAAALCASQRREERLCVTDHLNQYTLFHFVLAGCIIHPTWRARLSLGGTVVP